MNENKGKFELIHQKQLKLVNTFWIIKDLGYVIETSYLLWLVVIIILVTLLVSIIS